MVSDNKSKFAKPAHKLQPFFEFCLNVNTNEAGTQKKF